MHTTNNDICHGNVGPLQPGKVKEQASNRTNIKRSMLSIIDG